MGALREIKLDEYKNIKAVNLSGNADSFSRESFYHYSSLETITLILETNRIWLSRMSSSHINDLDEKRFIGHNPDRMFFASFCNSNSDVLPMWVLYAVDMEKGAAIGITPGKMRDWLINIDKVTVNSNVGELELIRDKDFKLHYGWCIYHSGKKIKIKNKSYIFKGFDSNNVVKKDEMFRKQHQWNYEKEFRIIVEITNENIKCENINHVELDISKIPSVGKKIKLSPQMKNDPSVKNELAKRFGINKDKITKSKLKTNIDLRKKLSDIDKASQK